MRTLWTILKRLEMKLQIRVLRRIETDHAGTDQENASQITDCALYIREALQALNCKKSESGSI